MISLKIFKNQTHFLYFIVPLILSAFLILPVLSEVELPEIPKRPTLEELKKSLRNKINKNKKENKEIVLEIKNEDKK